MMQGPRGVADALCGGAAFIAEQCGLYTEGQIRLNNVYVYTTLVNNFSQLWALYCLVLMFMATKEQLAPIRPLSKFIVVKAVVFFSFWQSVIIALLAWAGIIQSSVRTPLLCPFPLPCTCMLHML